MQWTVNSIGVLTEQHRIENMRAGQIVSQNVCFSLVCLYMCVYYNIKVFFFFFLQVIVKSQAFFKFLLWPWVPECEILCAPFKGGVSISLRPLAKSEACGLQSQSFKGLFSVQDPQARDPDTGPGPLSPGGESLQL